jgi:ribosomal protein S18 acetylase RimI-like enzyme
VRCLSWRLRAVGTDVGESMTDADRVTEWLREVALARAGRTVGVPGGAGLLHDDFPAAHDHNRLLLWSAVDAPDAAAAADAVLGGAGLTHRLIDVQSTALADHLADGLQALGYQRSDELVMTYAGGDAPADTTADVVELDLPQRAIVAAAGWRDEQPDWPADVSRQLGERICTVGRAVDATFLAVGGDAGVVARTDLYVRDAVAQIEEVVTDPAARRQGFASALIDEAVGRAQRGGADLIFLITDADDGAAPLYRRLGFIDLHTMASFTR